MKIDINKDFETAYQQSIWKGSIETADYGGAAFAHGDGIMVVLWYFLNVPREVYVEFWQHCQIPVLGLFK